MNKFIKKIIERIYCIIRAPLEANKFKKWYREYTLKTFIYVCLDGIGDAVWFMSFWKQYLTTNQINDNYKILIPNRLKDIFFTYGENNLIYDCKDSYDYILKLWASGRIKKYPKIQVMAYPRFYKKQKERIMGENFWAALGLMMDMCYKFGCFDLPMENTSLITQPMINETKVDITTKKNILLMPYARSRVILPQYIWEEIADIFINNGYAVYTNIGGETEKPIKNTIPFYTTITELPAILNKFSFISICARCGLADWLFVCECKQIVLHSCIKNPKNRREWLCSQYEKKDSFKTMKRNCNLNESTVEDVWIFIDDLTNDYIQNIYNKVVKISKVG